MLATLSILIVLAFLATVAVELFRRPRASEPAGPPAYELIRRIESTDATRALEIFRGDHGLFRYHETRWREPDTDDPYEVEGVWSPTMRSGLFDSAAAAELDAHSQIAWLRETISA